MSWDEPWRREERPSASEIPDKYGVVPDGRGRILMAYFIGLYVVYYAALKLFGGQAVLLGGYPLLMWLVLGLITLTIAGMFVLVWRPEVRAQEQSGSDPEVTSSSMEGD
jgi:membrane protein implicated in regulation of membrane protease activity